MTHSIAWQSAHSYSDIRYETAEGIAKITINRPERRNAFRPETVKQLIDAFHRAHHDNAIGAIILTGAGNEAFCSGGDQKVRGEEGYIDEGGTPHLNVLDLQMQIRRLPKPVVAMVAGFAIGGVAPLGHLRRIDAFLDPRLLEFDQVWAAAGTPFSVFPLAPTDLQRLTGAPWADVHQEAPTA